MFVSYLTSERSDLERETKQNCKMQYVSNVAWTFIRQSSSEARASAGRWNSETLRGPRLIVRRTYTRPPNQNGSSADKGQKSTERRGRNRNTTPSEIRIAISGGHAPIPRLPPVSCFLKLVPLLHCLLRPSDAAFVCTASKLLFFIPFSPARVGGINTSSSPFAVIPTALGIPPGLRARQRKRSPPQLNPQTALPNTATSLASRIRPYSAPYSTGHMHLPVGLIAKI